MAGRQFVKETGEYADDCDAEGNGEDAVDWEEEDTGEDAEDCDEEDTCEDADDSDEDDDDSDEEALCSCLTSSSSTAFPVCNAVPFGNHGYSGIAHSFQSSGPRSRV